MSTERPPRKLADVDRTAAANIRRIRKRRGLSEQGLADKVTALGHPLSRVMLSKKERTKASILISDLVFIAQALDVEPSKILAQTSCDACGDAPPPGYTCKTCGVG
jgi:transcriptional regulator with XRE-family HTH domain